MSRQRIIYFLAQPHRIGQLVTEMWHLRNVFFDYDIIVITPPVDHRVNKPVYDFVMRGVKVLHKHPGQFNWSSTDGIKNIDGDLYFFLSHCVLHSEFIGNFLGRKYPFYFSLTNEDVRRSNHLREMLGIPLNAPIVTLHSREAGYLPELTYHSYRDTDIESHIPAIEYLVSKGYYIVRIGDRTMKPLPDISDKVIDAPFHPLYSGYFELYFIALSRFMITTTSGPDALALGLGVPKLNINVPILSINAGNENDLFVMKKYYSHILKRYLTYNEIVMSPLIGFLHTEQYEQFGVELHQNSPEEILQAVKEMEARLEGSYDLDENANVINSRLNEVEKRSDYFLQHAKHNFIELFRNDFPKHLDYKLSNYYLYWSKSQISHEFIKMNPWFLEEKYWTPDIEVIGTTTNGLQKDKLLQKISDAEIKPVMLS